jgi:acetyl-CoA acetyltransferase family protein
MPEAVVVSAVRTAIGTSFKGSLTETLPEELARVVVDASVERAGLDPQLYDDVVLAESNYGGGALARHAAVETGLLHVPGTAVNRHCAGSLTAVQVAAASVRSGMDRVVIAGGAHSASLNPQQRRRVPGTADEWVEDWMSPAHPDSADAPNRDMTITVGWNTAVEAGLTREEMDAWALRSHERAIAAIDAGLLVDEIVPIRALQRDGSYVDFAVDEHPRRGTSMDRLAALKPVHPEIAGFSITAGNSSGINDGAAAVLVMEAKTAERLGCKPIARVVASAVAGVDPSYMGLGPIPSTRKALERAGLSIDAMDLIELNEAFAAQAIPCMRELGMDSAKVNVNGGAIAIGHPLGSTGARLLTTLVHEMRRRGSRYGLVTMCIGVGQGIAMVVEKA